jgi:diguanylate cyclase (GGDEF)-like protein
MFGSAAFSSLNGAKSQSADSNAAIARELNSAAMDGDDARVKRLLAQLLQCRSRSSTDRIQEKVAALEDLFYAMRTLAVTDELTGVYNRRGFDWVASRLLSHLCRERRGALLMYVDIDNLKLINDSVGHSAGDRLLAAAGKVLRTACGDGAIIGRIGGDEFALLARQTGAETHAMLRARIYSAIDDCNATGLAPPLSMSIGVADFDPLRPASVLALLDQADRAMYAEKFRKVPAVPPVAAAPAPARLALAASAG